MKDARTILQEELARRCEADSKYSLRKFAKNLGLSHTVLSLVFSGKRPLSIQAAKKVSTALKFNRQQQQDLFKNRKSHPVKSRTRKIEPEDFPLFFRWHVVSTLGLIEISGA